MDVLFLCLSIEVARGLTTNEIGTFGEFFDKAGARFRAPGKVLGFAFNQCGDWMDWMNLREDSPMERWN